MPVCSYSRFERNYAKLLTKSSRWAYLFNLHYPPDYVIVDIQRDRPKSRSEEFEDGQLRMLTS